MTCKLKIFAPSKIIKTYHKHFTKIYTNKSDFKIVLLIKYLITIHSFTFYINNGQQVENTWTSPDLSLLFLRKNALIECADMCDT